MDCVNKALVKIDSVRLPVVERHILDSNITIKDALAAINRLSGDVMTLFTVDSEGHLNGSLTDGDIRRALISGKTLDSNVREIRHTKVRVIREGEPALPIICEARNKGIVLLPITDKEGYITDLIDLRLTKSLLPLDAVLMAGGKGERLRPFTNDCPKPLLEVGGRAIIDYNIDELVSNGITNIFVTVNYLGHQIENHFCNRKNVTCIRENTRLGTAGSLSLLKSFLKHENLILMNSDILTDINFEDMYLHHVSANAALTIGAVPYPVSIPYAILETKGDAVTSLSEKPTFNYFANGGVYIMRRELADRIQENEYLDAPDFISDLIAEGIKISFYPIKGTWIDIGSPDDFRYANELMSRPKIL